VKIGGRDSAQPHQRDACRRKVRHDTEALAEAAAFAAWAMRRHVVFPYRCKWCGFWHLTRCVHS